MKFTEELKVKYQAILELRSSAPSLELTADQIELVIQFATELCEHISKFGVTISGAIVDSSKTISADNLQNLFTVFDYACYLDNYISADCTDRDFFLKVRAPELTNNPLIKRDLVLKIQSYLKQVVDKVDSENPKIQTYLTLFDKSILALDILTFTIHSNPESLDDLITNAFIELIIISHNIAITDTVAEMCESSIDYDRLLSHREQLLGFLNEIQRRDINPALSVGIFKTCFGTHYKGLGANFEQLKTSSDEILANLDQLISEQPELEEPESADASLVEAAAGAEATELPTLPSTPPRPTATATATPQGEQQPKELTPFNSPGISSVITGVSTPIIRTGLFTPMSGETAAGSTPGTGVSSLAEGTKYRDLSGGRCLFLDSGTDISGEVNPDDLPGIIPR